MFSGCAQNHVPPGSEYAMAETLIRHELASPLSYLGANSRSCPCFVLVGNKDLPSGQLAALSTIGPQFLPGNAWAAGRGMRIVIGLPRRRWNGNFDVTYSYYCGIGCAGAGTALVRYNGSRWRVIESVSKSVY